MTTISLAHLKPRRCSDNRPETPPASGGSARGPHHHVSRADWATKWSLAFPARLARRLIQDLVLFPALRVVAAPLEVRGTAHLDGLSGPLVIVANHSSHLDAPLLARSLPVGIRRRLAVAAAEDYFFCHWWQAVPAAIGLNAIPLPRKGKCGRVALARCDRLIETGWSILLFPEGTRSTGGTLGPMHTGAARLAARHGVPIVPVYIDGASRLLPKGCWRPRRGPVTVTCGAPMLLPPHIDARVATVAIEAAVRSLAP